MNKPLPIETAPKDGRRLLLFEWERDWQLGRWFDDRWETDDLQCGGTAVALPTHWASLPGTPEPSRPGAIPIPSEDVAAFRHLKDFFDGMYDSIVNWPISDKSLALWIEDARLEPPTAFRRAFDRVHEIISRKG